MSWIQKTIKSGGSMHRREGAKKLWTEAQEVLIRRHETQASSAQSDVAAARIEQISRQVRSSGLGTEPMGNGQLAYAQIHLHRFSQQMLQNSSRQHMMGVNSSLLSRSAWRPSTLSCSGVSIFGQRMSAVPHLRHHQPIRRAYSLLTQQHKQQLSKWVATERWLDNPLVKRMWGHWAYDAGRHHSLHLPPMARLVSSLSFTLSRSQIIPKALAIAIGEATRQRTSGRQVAHAEQLYGHSQLQSLTVPLKGPLVSALENLLEGLILFLRAVYLVILFTPAVVSGPLADVAGGRYRQMWLELVHRSLESAGAAFIKWGQWAATRPDLFPKDMCKQLSMLHSKAPAHSFQTTKRTVERAFGRKLSEIFDEFEEEPVASGSIAQVHRAVLRRRYPGQQDEPEMVAVKVRHPGVREIIHRDFVIMNSVAKISSLMPGLRWLRLEDSVQQFAVFMLAQVDLAREAAQLSRFNFNFRKWRSIAFPRPVYPLVHPEVLVETFEKGQSVARFVDRPNRDHINVELARLGSRTLLKMLLIDNFIHADLHPGNILVRMSKNTVPRPNNLLRRPHPEIVLLDVGMTAELPPQYRSNMREFFKAVAVRDGRTAAKCTLRFTRQQSCSDPQAFIDEVDSSFKKWDALNLRVPTGDCMQELLEQVRRHRVNIDGDVCAVIITTLVLESWQRKLDPDLSIMDHLKKLLFKPEWAASLTDTLENLMSP